MLGSLAHHAAGMAHGHDSYLGFPRSLPADSRCAETEDLDAFARAQRAELVQYFRAHLPTEADAQDAAQESLLRLLRYRDEPESAWRPLLFRIGNNVIAEFYRRHGARHADQHVTLEAVPLVSETPEHEERIEHRQRRALLREAVLALSPRSRQIYLLARADGLTYAQIAKRCGISVKAVEKSMARTMTFLAEHVGGGDRRAS